MKELPHFVMNIVVHSDDKSINCEKSECETAARVSSTCHELFICLCSFRFIYFKIFNKLANNCFLLS